MPRPYTIARLAAAAGVHVETIRYYQRLKLVPEPPRPLGGIRRYTEADADRLRFIKRAQAMGFTLAEIVNLLALQRRRSCHATRELAATKLRLVDTRIRELRRLRQELAGLIADCDANAEGGACPVIRRLASQMTPDARLSRSRVRAGSPRAP
jgi:MerR family transcriptional regulator, mercuric resistance operon regulatory protein